MSTTDRQLDFMCVTGRASSEKIREVIQQINNAGASALMLTALDDIACE